MANRGPESPLMKLARVLGGVVLTHGGLGHQVLGQILITNLTQAEFAGAALVASAGSRQRNVFARAAISTAAPALAVQALVDRADRRLTRREQDLIQREGQLAQQSNEQPEPQLEEVRARLEAATQWDLGAERKLLEQREQIEALQRSCDEAMVEIAGLKNDKLRLEAQLDELRRDAATPPHRGWRSDDGKDS